MSSDPIDDFDDAPRGHVEPHRGVLILVLGVLGIMQVCFICGIAAWIMGKRDLDLMKQGAMDREGEAMTRVGYILGIVSTILLLVSLLFVCAIFGLMFVARGAA